MAADSLPQRVVRIVGDSPWSERVADAQERIYAPLITWVRESPLHSDVLGHSLHPMLTDVTIGCWIGTSVLDLVGGDESRRGASTLAALGVLAAMPTALAGAADWSEMCGTERRIGAVHAIGTDIAIVGFIGSLIARRRGAHRVGARLALAANLVIVGAGYLGGHLALQRGAAGRTA